MENIVEFRDVNFKYKNNFIFENANVKIKSGSFAAIIGPNGVGKTTLLELLLGRLNPQGGKIILNSSKKIGYIPQLSAAISNEFPITVKEIMCLDLCIELRKLKPIDKVTTQNIKNILEKLGLADKLNSVFSDLSGGQKQKVMIGKALVSDPDLLVMDEPSIGLDEESRRKLLEILKKLQKERGVSIIMVTHDLEEIKEFADEIYTIEKKRILKTDA